MTGPMFPEGPRRDYELSQLTATPDNLARGDTPRWTSIKAAKAPTCDECAALAWETRGTQRTNVARTKRTIRKAELYLCNPHASLWRTRDLDA